jgi:rubrerythrin
MNRLKNRKYAALAVAAVLLLAGAVWAVRGYLAYRQLAKVKAMSQQLKEARQLTPAERQAKFADFRKAVGSLSPRQRQELFAEGRRASTDKLRQFLKMPKREQQAKLDQDIKRMEQRRQEFAKMRTDQAKSGSGPNAANPWGNRATGRLDPDQRDERARRRLDNSTPEERAARSEYRQLLDQRRQQLGLPAGGRWGWR